VDLPVIVPALHRFVDKHPGLRMLVSFNDRLIDVVGEGVDALVRVGELVDSQLISRHLYDAPFVACASPEFLRAHGVPKSPHDLKQLACFPFYQSDHWSHAALEPQERQQARRDRTGFSPRYDARGFDYRRHHRRRRSDGCIRKARDRQGSTATDLAGMANAEPADFSALPARSALASKDQGFRGFLDCAVPWAAREKQSRRAMRRSVIRRMCVPRRIASILARRQRLRRVSSICSPELIEDNVADLTRRVVEFAEATPFPPRRCAAHQAAVR
jgi:hypothetical protein